MANITLFYRNKVDGGTLSGGSWETLLPLTNLQNRIIARKARSTDATTTNTQFVLDLGASNRYKGLVLVNHNASVDGLVRITTSSDNFSTTNFQTDWLEFYPAIFDTYNLEWEDDNWWEGTLTTSDLTNYPKNYLYVFDLIQTSRYIKVEIDDTGNPDGYFELGRLFLAESFTPVTNMSWGKTSQWDDISKVDEALGGTLYFDQREKYRSINLSLALIPDSVAMQKMYEIYRELGSTGEVYIAEDYEDLGNSFRTSFLGIFSKMGAIEQHTYGYQSTSFSIREIK